MNINFYEVGRAGKERWQDFAVAGYAIASSEEDAIAKVEFQSGKKGLVARAHIPKGKLKSYILKGSNLDTATDMLRYDDGIIVDVEPIPIEVTEFGRKRYTYQEVFIAVRLSRFTYGMWRSFGWKLVEGK